MNKENLIYIYIITLLVAIIVGGIIGITSKEKSVIEVTTASCPMLFPEVKRVEIDKGWICTEPQIHKRDLLQPSGLWINKQFDCWKLADDKEKFIIKYNNELQGKK